MKKRFMVISAAVMAGILMTGTPEEDTGDGGSDPGKSAEGCAKGHRDSF